jgi:hypothetical protein
VGKIKGRCKFILTAMLLLSELTLIYFDIFHSLQCRGSEHAISTEEVEVGKWAKSVASKSQRKPSVPPSARASGRLSFMSAHIANSF